MSRSSPPRSSTDERANDAASPAARRAEPSRTLRRRIATRTAAVTRWLHIYLSMFGLIVVLFFSATGLTLNHPDWFGEAERQTSAKGRMATEWLGYASTLPETSGGEDALKNIAKLEVVEYLRKTHAVRGALVDFHVDEKECTVTFKGPGYAADAFIDRESGQYDLTQTAHGFVAVINDLHKGRDTGQAWSAVIDVSAIALAVISLTGLVLLLYLKRRRIPGLLVVVGGTVAVVAVFLLFIP